MLRAAWDAIQTHGLLHLSQGTGLVAAMQLLTANPYHIPLEQKITPPKWR